MRKLKTPLKALLVGSAAVGLVALAVPAFAAPTSAAAIQNANAPGTVPDRYIVVFKDDSVSRASVSAKANDLAGKHGGEVKYTYDSILRGFSVSMKESQALALAKNPMVKYVEQAVYATVTDTQPNAPWGLDRVDQRDLPLNQTFDYPANPGQGVHVYIVDSGLNSAHQDFTGRVGAGRDLVDNDSTPQDCNGHGTHVAGSAAGTTYGLAKKATVHAVRVLDCAGSGTSDAILGGMNWVKTNGIKPAVVNFSIGCRSRCTQQSWDDGAKAVIDSGIQWVQAAGNSNDDACYYSPQKLPAAVTVGNSNQQDARYTGTGQSNYGSCLDIWAPGTSIVSASHSSNTGTATMTGTSMASPHVAGAAALYLGQNTSATPAQVRDALVNNGSTGKLSGINTGSPNVLLYTGFMNGPVDPPCSAATNTNDVAIPDNNTAITSSVTVTGCSGAGTAATSVKVDINHTYTGDLVIDLVGPTGKVFNLKQAGGASSSTGVHQTFTVNTGAETAKNGEWKLRVTDVYRYDTGNIDAWTLTF
ncbi:S8 family peptidase [Actinokineospora xionganensis]|uniref:S8 family peptidase n=1 Tax=Actinokineospora xionganensis TaxID=2684470 RepID=A0ABR7LCT1_9PSEU|nr:S8 family peptidase [Actinokineospora xionganensis]MBC6450201.1 S8 family peptidase [Actinokineospora xionganensis]